MRSSSLGAVGLVAALFACGGSAATEPKVNGVAPSDGGSPTADAAVDGDRADSGGGYGGDASDGALRYAGQLQWVFCDWKRPLAELDGAVTSASLPRILDGFARLGCNGVRTYIDPDIADASKYPALYEASIAEARARGFRLYANPLGTGDFGKTDREYVDWIVAYQKVHQIRWLGPFNEFGPNGARLLTIATGVRNGVSAGYEIVGPDAQHVDGSTALLTPSLRAQLDVVGSHDAVGDESATTSGWNALVGAANGRPVWASEDPRPLSATSSGGQEIGVAAVIASKAVGLVLYEAFPACVDESGALTAKGQAIAAALRPP